MLGRHADGSGVSVNPSQARTSAAIERLLWVAYSVRLDRSPRISRSKTQLSQSWKTALLATDQIQIPRAITPARRRTFSIHRRLLLFVPV